MTEPARDRVTHEALGTAPAAERVIVVRKGTALEVVPDLLVWDFTAAEPNRRYVGDITYLPQGCHRRQAPVPGARHRPPATATPAHAA